MRHKNVPTNGPLFLWIDVDEQDLIQANLKTQKPKILMYRPESKTYNVPSS